MSYVHWSRAWREEIGDDEEKFFEEFALKVADIARDVAIRTKAAPGRVFHLKKHTGVTGVLRVLHNLGEPLNSGVFAAARDWPCYVRFSNGAVRKMPDGGLDVRGCAIKLVGVPGAKVLPEGEAAGDVTQDFLFVQTPAVPTDSFDEFLALARASVGGPLLVPVKLAFAVGPLAAARILVRLAQVPQPVSLAGATFYNAVPIQLGAAAAKLSLVPVDDVTDRRGATYREDLVARLRTGPLRFRLRAQLYTDDRRTPIESASVAWRGPFYDVADLELPRQDVESARGSEIDSLVDTLAFNPWHAVVAHKPLGKTNRARVAAYRASTFQRRAAAEPTSVLTSHP